MTLRLCSLVLVIGACAWTQPVSLPDTPAGHTLRAWLDAFNSGDKARMQAYIAKYEPGKDPQQALDGMLAFRDQTGGFELLSINKSEPLHLDILVKERGGQTTALGMLEVKDGDPAEVVSFSLRALPPGAKVSDLVTQIDAAERARVIDGVVKNLNESYVYPEIAAKMSEALRARQTKGEYDAVTDGAKFALLLTDHLREVSHDKHLRVDFSPAILPKLDQKPDAPALAQMRAQMERNNCFFEKAERLPNNIGYLKFNAFPSPDMCGATATAAMNFLGNSDAIIFDLRDNGGGDPNMITLLCTYLFAEPTHLNDLYDRPKDTTTQYWTLPYAPGKSLAGKPVYILTSARTFSGAEEFSYDLKNLKRATLIGETTGGGAHPVSGHRIDDHFMIGVPFARAINPISKTNWEGTGVEPDVKVPASQALDTAKKMAEEQIRKNASTRP
jgi:retinol-binding protein 3